jgi:protein-tyrosine phosphatase
MYEIIPNLYLGNFKDSKDLTDIDIVINCTDQLEFFGIEDKIGIRIPVLDIGDKKDNDIMFECMPKVCKLIDKYLSENKKILVHCFACMSRSPTVIVGYTMWRTKCTIGEAVYFLKKRKGDVFIGGYNFEEFLHKWYKFVIEK